MDYHQQPIVKCQFVAYVDRLKVKDHGKGDSLRSASSSNPSPKPRLQKSATQPYQISDNFCGFSLSMF